MSSGCHVASSGSSPLSRGIPGLASRPDASRRIIPALAGNTRVYPPRCGNCRDHPRSRGEYLKTCGSFLRRQGSSPLSRGIRELPEGCSARFRIIPALAGNTFQVYDTMLESTDHPRSRGEYLRAASMAALACGSSPLSRGILAHWDDDTNCVRIIPALAGNTKQPSRTKSNHQDHPRSRGEYSDISDFAVPRSGSSPLSRGIPRCVL